MPARTSPNSQSFVLDLLLPASLQDNTGDLLGVGSPHSYGCDDKMLIKLFLVLEDEIQSRRGVGERGGGGGVGA